MTCPGMQDTADTFEGHTPRQRSNFTNIEHNLSYAVQNPCATQTGSRLASPRSGTDSILLPAYP
jgi:hypothetical protein